ncbi:hypothetical protein WA026_021929 [Henosepilachna vigintioctopunctata]|uniref:Uncharacterized protein n=1 Tax=Henosepilachna vigintioctopunctata TaxID=420089 RepID=A0AAW1VAN5_9CUCU
MYIEEAKRPLDVRLSQCKLHTRRVEISKLSIDDHACTEHHNTQKDEMDLEGEEDFQQLPGSPAAQSCSQKRKKAIVEHLAHRNDLSKKDLGQLAKKDNRDEASVYADSCATSFRKLSATQKIYAKKAIEDILVLGQPQD